MGNFQKAHTSCNAVTSSKLQGDSSSTVVSNQKNCALDVLGGLQQTIGGIGWIADAVSRCAPVQYKESLCFGAITKTVAQAVALSQAILGIEMKCPGVSDAPHSTPPDVKERVQKLVNG